MKSAKSPIYQLSCVSYATPNTFTVIVSTSFGKEFNAGRIDYRVSYKERAVLREILSADDSSKSLFNRNLSYKRFKANYGSAVQLDPNLNTENRIEWNREVAQEDGSFEEILCNAEDVRLSAKCSHSKEDVICSECSTPTCNECWRHASRKSGI